ncbi:FkbM family methyltransferase [Acidisphaera sp. L21]|uniref:FkbM family methyltransferase n=1 Tax=Acidisphaera sp. L21 TaxID=1641851 RepID=UPI00131DF6C5|nr:FkbM family methyltransferase [Acidisphaera sp. L21]
MSTQVGVPEFQKAAFAQFGEDGVLAWLFHGRKNGFYVDVGCHHPFRFSNTALLHNEQGWSGINIDVDERATALFKQHRPFDTNITMGVAGEAGIREVTIFDEGAINSFDKEAAAHPAWANIPRQSRMVEVEPLGSILHRTMPKGRQINLLNIDAEGLDVEILASNDWAVFTPEVITVEVHNFDLGNVQANETYRFLLQKGYQLVSHVALTSIYRLASFQQRQQPVGVSHQEAIWLYRCILGREPESPETVVWFANSHASFEDARKHLLDSLEFKIKNVGVKDEYFIPEKFPATFTKSAKRVGLAVIVRDEAANIENMLRSCAPLLDHVSLIDTGSTDGTVDIARGALASLGLPNTIKSIAFEDFSHARNAALEVVPSSMDWVLMLDADEELVAADYWRFNALLEADDNIDGWQLPRMNFADLAKRKPLRPYPDYQSRLFRNHLSDPVRFSGRVHERPQSLKWGFAPLNRSEVGEIGGPHIHHLGYADITQARWQKKHDFYTKLAGQDKSSS